MTQDEQSRDTLNTTQDTGRTTQRNSQHCTQDTGRTIQRNSQHYTRHMTNNPEKLSTLYTRHKTNNPEKLSTLYTRHRTNNSEKLSTPHKTQDEQSRETLNTTQDTGRTIQRSSQHYTRHRTKTNRTQTTKGMSNTDATKHRGWTQVLAKGSRFLPFKILHHVVLALGNVWFIQTPMPIPSNYILEFNTCSSFSPFRFLITFLPLSRQYKLNIGSYAKQYIIILILNLEILWQQTWLEYSLCVFF